MVTRIVSGIMGAFLVVLVLIFNQSLPILMNILISLVCILSLNEIFSALGLLKRFFITIPCYMFAAIIPFFISSNLFLPMWATYTFVMFALMILYNEVISIKDMALIYTFSVSIIFCLSTIIILRNFNSNYALFYMIISLSTAWMTDTGAYFCGNFLGKHKLCPKVSPKKTVEGAIGGILTSMFSLLIVCFIFNTFIFNNNVNINYLFLLVMGFFGAIISIIGDLSFSLMKRGCSIKDFGNVIPGHGGILDRIDSIIFTIPFILIFINYFPIINL